MTIKSDLPACIDATRMGDLITDIMRPNAMFAPKIKNSFVGQQIASN